MPPRITVIIANWNGRHHLARCLPALAQQSYTAHDVIVVDNGSTDGSQAWLAQQHPAVRVIANDRNLGFAVANNQGIAAADGEYVALLNNDAWPEPAWLAALAQALEADPRAGMAASLMLFADRPAIVNSTGICVDRCGISWDRDGGRAAAAIDPAVVEIFGASAGAALYRRQLFDDVGVFEASFFAYLEDVDLAWRARWRGWRAVFVPQARVLHAHSATGHEGSPFKTYWLARNKLALIARNYPAPYLWRYLPLILAYDALSLLNALLRQSSLSPLRGRMAGWAALRAAWRQRQVIQSQAAVPASQVFGLLERADWPWRVQQKRYAHLRGPAASPSPPP